jgi:HK97 gp10 family phage protein
VALQTGAVAVMASSKFTDRDLGYDDFIKLIKDSASGKTVAVGVFSGEIASYAAVNEYGTKDKRIPARPFMRTTFDRLRDDLSKQLRNEVNALIAKGETKVDNALIRVGLQFTNDIKLAIRGWTEPPNAESTIEKKGVNNPLVDNGILNNSITFEVRKK